jgi:hypothetical protein
LASVLPVEQTALANSMTEPFHRTPALARALDWRELLLAYVYLAAFWFSSGQLAEMDVLALGVHTLLLTGPVWMALWHQATIGKILSLHQLNPDRWLHRWISGRTIGALTSAVLAIFFSALALLQSEFFGTLEWTLLVTAPVICQFVRWFFERNSTALFSTDLYAQRWSRRARHWVLVLVLAALWVSTHFVSADAANPPLSDRIFELQREWAQVPSGIVKWALDAGAWGQASIETMGAQSSEATWRIVLAAIFAPLSVFTWFALALAGLALPAAELRRLFGRGLNAEPCPPDVGASRSAVLSASAVIFCWCYFLLLGNLDSQLRIHPSPLALAPKPECERIDGKVYQLNTSALLTSLLGDAKNGLRRHSSAACAKLSDVEKTAEKGVNAYLDWYFSLGGEWARTSMMLTGDIDLFLESKFNQLVLSNPDVARHINSLQKDHESQLRALTDSKSLIQDLLDRNRMVVGAAGCKVVREHVGNPWTKDLEGTKARLTASSGSALVAGVFTAKVATKVMGKASMKSASKVLAKALAKKGTSIAASTVAGAAIGSTMVPVLGTAVGAVAGLAAGVAIGVAVDVVALAAEEGLTRDGMKKDLLSSFTETLQPYRDTFECK